MESWVASSAPSAARKPSMAERPLMTSGAGPRARPPRRARRPPRGARKWSEPPWAPRRTRGGAPRRQRRGRGCPSSSARRTLRCRVFWLALWLPASVTDLRAGLAHVDEDRLTHGVVCLAEFTKAGRAREPLATQARSKKLEPK